MSKFLNVDEDSQEEEQQVEKPKDDEQPKGPVKKKDKKNKKKKVDDEFDKILEEEIKAKGGDLDEQKLAEGQQALDPEAEAKAKKKKEKKERQAEKKKQGDQPIPQEQEQNKKKKDNKPSAIAEKIKAMQEEKERELKRIKEEEERLKREEEERLQREKEEKERKEKLEEERRLQKKKEKEELKKQGLLKTKKQLEEEERSKQLLKNVEIKTEVQNKSNVVKAKRKVKPQQQQQQQAQPPEEKEDQTNQFQQIDPQQVQQPVAAPASKVKAEIQDDGWDHYVDEEEDMVAKQKEAYQQKQEEASQEQQLTNAEKNRKELLKQYQQVGEFRSPICCILGHVDTGKTTLLDKIRNTNVQEGEAGGITQQIGATFFPGKKLTEELTKTQQFYPVDCKVPGLLIIDTPGHESFANLRNRGSSLCDLAVLVIDLMHGIQKQTLESLELLKKRKTPFVIALNKIDRCVEWKKKNNASSYQQLQGQTKNCKMDYETKRQHVFTQLAENGFNVALYWENQDPTTYISVIPTSGVTGEGIPDLLTVIVKYTSVYMKNKIKLKNQFNCTVLEKKVTEGHGTTIDCLLVDGEIQKDDRIIVAGFNGPIITKIKALLTPHPMKEMRVKGEFIWHERICASMGIKISAIGLEEAVAGSQLYLVKNQEEQERAVQCITNEMEEFKKLIKLQNQGVGVAASTLGSLEALLVFLEASNIPVSYVRVGPVSKDDVMKVLKNILTEDVNRRKKEFACMLVFDIKVLPDAQKYAEENQIKIFEANIIYHLFDKFTEFIKSVRDERKKKDSADVVFPCILKPVKIIRASEPVIIGVEVESGVLKIGTPICLYDANKMKIGIVETIEYNHKTLKEARQVTGAVAIRLGNTGNVQGGKTFTLEDRLVSMMTRRAIDVLKEHYRDDITLDDWTLVKDLKSFFQIP